MVFTMAADKASGKIQHLSMKETHTLQKKKGVLSTGLGATGRPEQRSPRGEGSQLPFLGPDQGARHPLCHPGCPWSFQEGMHGR